MTTPDVEDVDPPHRSDLTIDSPERTVTESADPPASVFPRPVTDPEFDFLAALELQIQQRFPEGLRSWSSERTSEIAARALDGYPTDWLIGDIGPAFDTGELARYWGISERTIRRRIAAGTVFTLKTAHGRCLYPDLQLDSRGAVDPGILDLLARGTHAMAGDRRAAARWIITTTEPAHITHIRRGHFDCPQQLLEQIRERATQP